MLNPELIVSTVVSAIQTIPEVLAAMNGDASRIAGFNYLYGVENTLAEAVGKLIPPAILVVWTGTGPGRGDGMTLWKHSFNIYLRSGNMASVAFPAVPTGPGYLWWAICNKPVNGLTSPPRNIREVQLIPGALEIMDIPSVLHRQDEELMDYFCGSFVFPEIGDQ